jgi:hypothetical protein
MKKFLIFIFAIITLNLNAANIVRGPYTQDPELTTAVIRFSTDEPTPAWIEYGPQGQCNLVMTNSPKQKNHVITLHGLIPNTQFCYKVYVQNQDETGVQEGISGTFSTAYTAERKELDFMVIGNTSDPNHNAGGIKKQLAQSMLNHKADFLIHTGNIATDGSATNVYADFYEPFKEVLKQMPYMAALGEDEYGPNKNTQEGKGFLNANYKPINSMPWSKGTPNYYYYDSANARIIVIDTNNLYDAIFAPQIEKNSKQYEWLKNSLATAGADKWKIVVMHHPVFSSGASEDKLSQFLAPLFEAHKVNLVLQGHQGAYERTKPIRAAHSAKAGPIYITIGGAGRLFEPSSYDNEWTSKYYATPHFAHIKIVDRKLSLRIYTHEDKKIDALDIYF